MAGKGASREYMEKIGKNTRFTSENQPENSGRRKSKITQVISENEYSTQDIRQALGGVLDIEDEKELEEKVADEKTKMFLKILYNGMKTDMAKGNFDNTFKILEYAYGKPKQIIENINTNINKETKDYLKMTPEERKEEKKKVIRKIIELYGKEDIKKELDE